MKNYGYRSLKHRFLFFACAALPFFQCADRPIADLVIHNAKIVTIDKDQPRTEAVAVQGETLLFVGSNEESERFIDPQKTRVIDAGGRLMTPGFNDAHCHFGPVDPNQIDLRYIRDPEIITERVRDQVRQARPGALISGRGWDHALFPVPVMPTRELLDSVAPENPVVLKRAGGHTALVNAFVLRASGIDRQTPDPPGGEIGRDRATGEPTGILKETAKALIRTGESIVQETGEERNASERRAWRAAFDMAARLGVTSVQIPNEVPAEMYQSFHDRGALSLRVTFCGALTDDPDRLKKYTSWEKTYPKTGDWIRFGFIKGFMDGNLGGGTALFHASYADEPGTTGLPRYHYKEFERLIIMTDSLGFQIGMHAIGDRANTWVLDAYEKARQLNGRRDSRHRIEHAQILIPEDIPRFAGLGVIASMQPTHCITDKNFCEKRIGAERSRGGYAWRSLLNAGARLAFGTDYQVEPLDPLEGLYAAVTRRDRFDRDDPGWFTEQCLTMEEAIELYTLGSAYAEFMENRKGMIRQGYLADLVLFEEDLMTMPAARIMENNVWMTIAGGKVVYEMEN